jgi:hypothetical protein
METNRGCRSGVVSATGAPPPQAGPDGPDHRELNDPHGHWKNTADATIATMEWVVWDNTERTHSSCGNIPPAEHEQTFHATATDTRRSGLESTQPASGIVGAIQNSQPRESQGRPSVSMTKTSKKHGFLTGDDLVLIC